MAAMHEPGSGSAEAGRRQIRVGQCGSKALASACVSTALYSTALRQMSTVITYLQYTRQCIQYCTIGLHCTICNTMGEYCRCNMHTSFSMSHAREKPLVEWCCTTDYVPTYPPTTWSCLTVSDKTHPATAASRTPRKKPPYASRLC